MPALHGCATGPALAAMDVELTQQRSAGDFGLILLDDLGFSDPAAAVGDRRRAAEALVAFVDLFGRWRGAMAVRAVCVARLASGCLGLFLGRSLGEGRCLAFAGPLALFERAGELFDLPFQVGNFLTQPQAFCTKFGHTGSIASAGAASCASLPESGCCPATQRRRALNNDQSFPLRRRKTRYDFQVRF